MDNDQVVVFEFKGRKYHLSQMLEFKITFDINSRPSGHVILLENDPSFLNAVSFQHARLHFIRSGEFNPEYNSDIDVEIITCELYQADSAYMYFKLDFECGNEVLNVSNDYCEVSRGTSYDSLQTAIKKASTAYEFEPLVNKSISSLCIDVMKWIHPKNSFWSKITNVVSRSYMSNDYLFYSVVDISNDDKNHFLKVDSIKSVMDGKCDHLFASSPDVYSSDINAMRKIKDEKVRYNYNNISYESDIMKYRDDIFPNISILAVQGGILRQSDSGDSFFNFIKKIENGDGRANEIEKYLKDNGIEIKNVSSYGRFKQVVFGNTMGGDIHKYYSISNAYRNFYLSSYAKKVQLELNNTFGPSIGTKVALVKTVDNSFSNASVGDVFDEYYTDYYFIKSKTVLYNGDFGKKQDGAKPFIKTTFNLISGNIVSESEKIKDNIKSINKLWDSLNET